MFISNRSGFQPAGVIVCAIFAFAAIACAGTYSGGAGTEEDPYRIGTAEQMNTIGLNPEDWKSHFALMADLDMSPYPDEYLNLIGTVDWITLTVTFDGTFDGRGHTLSGLAFGKGECSELGLFRGIGTTGVIKNLGLISPTVKLSDCSVMTPKVQGILVGSNLGGLIENCWIEQGDISFGSSPVGCLVGRNSGTIRKCRVSGSVKADGAGGLVGGNHGEISDCYSECSILGSFHPGGLVGYNSGQIWNSYSAGPVEGGSDVGGLVGMDQGGILSNCYSTGIVLGTEIVGGFAGSCDSGTIFLNCFWDIQISGQSQGIGEGSSTSVTGKTTAEMKTLGTFVDAGWDFVYSDGNAPVWKMPAGGYPALFWEYRYSGGSGTAEDPYNISTVADWQELIATSADWDKCFILLNDIDFVGENVTPVGTGTKPFWGTFDGNAHVIRNLTINRTDMSNYVGLFGLTEWATIQNLGLENVQISSNGNYVGGLVGSVRYGKEIRSCYITGSVQGTGENSECVGGLVGGGSCRIVSCHTTCSVSGHESVGGLAGECGAYDNWGGVISCSATGSVNGTVCVGGLIGSNGNSLTKCYTTGSVSGTECIGGLIGWNGGSLTGCYTTGTVTGDLYIGGVAGINKGLLTSCYSTSPILGSGSYIGGLVGYNDSYILPSGTITSCYSSGSVSGTEYVGGLVGISLGCNSICEPFCAEICEPNLVVVCDEWGYCWEEYRGEICWEYCGEDCHCTTDEVESTWLVDKSFWDIQTSEQATSSGGEGKTTAEMKAQATFTSAGWDFVGEAANGAVDVWRMCADGVDYPRLSWEFGIDLDCPDGVGLEDLLYLSGRWLETGAEPFTSADRTGDGRVDLNELALLSGRWMENRGPIALKVYSDGWGTLMDTFTVLEEGSYKLRITDERPYYQPPMYFVNITRDGFYTEQYRCTAYKTPELPMNDFWITVNVDLDSVAAATFNGTIFLTQYYFASSPLNTIQVTARQEGTTAAVFQTDSLGRFSAELQAGAYVFEFNVPGDSAPYVEPVVISGAYQDIGIPNHVMMVKPNIYLYPESVMDLRVWMSFPYGGAVVTSIPDYGDGWEISADPSGLIDGEYDYLFYESSQGDRCQYKRGWVIEREELSGFFRENMEATGFNEREIFDFLSYWIPRLDEFPTYAIYPQYNEELARMNELHFSVRPDSIVRLLYAIRGLETGDFILPVPEIPRIEQRGFAVREWGVMLK